METTCFFRGSMRMEGIDLENPNSSLHLAYSIEHANYNRYVYGEINKLSTLAERNNWDQNQIQEEVRKLQSKLKHKLKEGELRCH